MHYYQWGIVFTLVQISWDEVAVWPQQESYSGLGGRVLLLGMGPATHSEEPTSLPWAFLCPPTLPKAMEGVTQDGHSRNLNSVFFFPDCSYVMFISDYLLSSKKCRGKSLILSFRDNCCIFKSGLLRVSYGKIPSLWHTFL